MELKLMKLDIEDKIAVLTIDNPPVNVFSPDLVQEMKEVQSRIDTSTIKVIVIRTEGKYFSAGVDLEFFGTLSSEGISNSLPGSQQVYNFWQDVNVPVIVEVQRLCVGLGTELILCSDICIASEGAKISLPEVNFGLSPDMGGSARLTRLVGSRRAKKILMLGEEMTAEEAERIGLIEFVVPEDELQDFTMSLAKKLAAKPSWAMRFAKKAVNVSAEGGLYAGLLFEQAQSTFCCGIDDKDEAVKAFFEKRAPNFD